MALGHPYRYGDDPNQMSDKERADYLKLSEQGHEAERRFNPSLILSRFQGDPNGGGYHFEPGGGIVADTWQGYANADAYLHTLNPAPGTPIPGITLGNLDVRDAYPAGDWHLPVTLPDGTVRRLLDPQGNGYVDTPPNMTGGSMMGGGSGSQGEVSSDAWRTAQDIWGSGSGSFRPRGGTPEQNDAFSTLKGFLDQYGLGSLSQWAWQQLLENRSPNEILLALTERPEYKQRFPAIELRQKAGLPAISPAEYIAYENQATQMFRAAGFPPGFYDQHDDFTKYLATDTSLAELSQRAALYTHAAYQAPQELRDQLRNLYGIDEGHIAAYLADPNRALPLLQQHETAAAVAGQAQRQKFGQLTVTEAERLASLGVTEDQASQGFGQVLGARELFQTLPGEQQSAAGRNEALGLVAGDSASLQAVDTQARRRRAPFGGGGSYATAQSGASGLGSAAT